MKHRLIVFAAVLATASCASVASAASVAPATGSWKGKATDGSDQSVGFNVVRKGDAFRVSSLVFRVNAPCTATDPNAGASVESIRGRRITVRLRRSGGKLQGTGKGKGKDGNETATLQVRVVVASKRRAVVTLRGRSVTKGGPTCNGRVVLTARPG